VIIAFISSCLLINLPQALSKAASLAHQFSFSGDHLLTLKLFKSFQRFASAAISAPDAESKSQDLA
jgi:hypothetical protein